MKKQILLLTITIIIVSLFASCAKATQPFTTAELLNLGNKYLTELNYEQAIVQFTKLIEVEPKNEQAYIGLAKAYSGQGDTDKSIEALRQGLEQLPNNAELTNLLNELLPKSEVAVSSMTSPDSNNFSIIGSVVEVELSDFSGPTYVDGFKFDVPVTMATGESVSVARINNDISVFGDEWIVYNNGIPQFSDAAYEQSFKITGQISLDETYSDGVVPHPNPDYADGFVNDPWGPWQFDILSVEPYF